MTVALVAGTAAGAGRADTTDATLSGESAAMSTAVPGGSATLDCGSATDGSGSYHLFGTTTGPYAGTIEETGSFTFAGSVVTDFHADFTIASVNGTVTGSKDLSQQGGMSCVPGPPIDSLTGNFAARYTATITPTGGSAFEDHGESPVTVTFVANAAGTQASVGQQFASDRDGSFIHLTPVEAVNVVGTQHTVTAVLQDPLLLPLAGGKILFTVEGSVVTTGTCRTGDDGTCPFTYVGPAEPGSDVITGCYDFDEDGTVDPGEKCATATKAWEPSESTPGSASGGGYVFDATSGDRVVFGFSARNNANGPDGHCNVHDNAGVKIKIKCLNVSLFAITGSHAFIKGEALQNGVATNYTINVDDLDKQGGSDTFSIQTDEGFVASGPVDHGNINVKP